MFVNVIPRKVGSCVCSRLRTPYFCLLHESLSSCALLHNIPHSPTYTMAHTLYKGGLDSMLDWRCWHLHSHLNSIHSHSPVGCPLIGTAPSLPCHPPPLATAEWLPYPFPWPLCSNVSGPWTPSPSLSIDIHQLTRQAGKCMVAKEMLTVVVDYALFYLYLESCFSTGLLLPPTNTLSPPLIVALKAV